MAVRSTEALLLDTLREDSCCGACLRRSSAPRKVALRLGNEHSRVEPTAARRRMRYGCVGLRARRCPGSRDDRQAEHVTRRLLMAVLAVSEPVRSSSEPPGERTLRSVSMRPRCPF